MDASEKELSERMAHFLEKNCNPSAIQQITGNGFVSTLINSFDQDFDHYMQDHYQTRVLDYSTIMETLDKKDGHHKLDNYLYVFNTQNGKYRPITQKDIKVVEEIARKYYQHFNEIDLRIKLLFDSKYGTRFLSKQTHVNPDLISKIRHHPTSIRKISPEDRLQLENFYLNSKLAKHISRLKVNFRKG